MTDAEHSSPSSADASCAVVCSSSNASPLSSLLCYACGDPIASIASPPPWTNKPPAYRPIRTLAINATIWSSSDASSLPPSLCCTCSGPTTSIVSLPPWTDKPPAYRSIRAPAINAASQTNVIILTPVPHPFPVPSASPPYHFETPTKRISSSDNLRRFHSSTTAASLALSPLSPIPSAAASSPSLQPHPIRQPNPCGPYGPA